MSHTKQQRPSTGLLNHNHNLSSEARLNRLYRLFKTHYNVTEPSIILEPYLYLGNCISAHDTNRLEELGINYILNVAIRDVELCPYYSEKIRTLTIDLRDDDKENILRIFDKAFAFIDEAKRNESRVLVHCSHGQSRSPAIVIAYLMRTYNVSLEQCLIHVIKARACVLPNDGFLKQLILYDRFLVEKRRRQQETEKKAAANHPSSVSTTTTEVTIQTTPVVLSPPQYPVNKTSNEPPPSSADSIHVIPIQVSSKQSRTEKIEPIPIKKIPVSDTTPTTNKSKSNNNKPLKENTSTTTDITKKLNKSNVEVTSSKNVAPSRKRQTTVVTDILKYPSPSSSSSYAPRSRSAHTDRKSTNYYNIYSPVSNTEQLNVATYYPTDYYLFKQEKKPTKYITEIYDKATNRYIPTKC